MSSIALALVTVIGAVTPPGMRSNNSACRRQAALFFWRPRSRCRLANSRKTRAWSSGRTTCRRPARNAATATERASLGSFFWDRWVSNTRTRAASTAGTSTTSSPAATSCWDSRYPNPAADSTAHRRWSNRAAQPNSSTVWAAEADTCSLPTITSSVSIATAVCDPLCGSIPIITFIALPSCLEDGNWGRHH